MNDIINSEIFFFISSIGFIVTFVLLSTMLFYLVKFAKALSRIIKKIEAESEKVVDDIENIRLKLKDESEKISGLGKWIAAFLFGKSVYKKARKKKED